MLGGCIAVYAVGTVSGWLAPQILFGVMHKYGVSAAQGGTLTLAEGVTAGLLSMALGRTPPRLSHRSLATCAFALICFTNGIVPWVPEFLPLLGLRFLAGVADAILMFVGVSLVAMHYPNPDRGYAVMTVAGSLYAALILGLLPVISPASLGLTYLPFSALVALLCAPLILLIPSHTRPGRLDSLAQVPDGARASSGRVALFALLLAIMVPLLAQAFAIVAFSPGVGAGLGMSERAVNMTLSVATLASIAGPFVAAAAAARFGRWSPFFLMAIVLLVCDLALLHTVSQGVFVCDLVLSQVAAYFFMPLLLGWSAELDPTGGYSGIMIGGVVVTTSLTPTFAGMLVDRHGLAVLSQFVIATGVTFIGLLILLYILTLGRRLVAPARESVATPLR